MELKLLDVLELIISILGLIKAIVSLVQACHQNSQYSEKMHWHPSILIGEHP